MPSLDGVLSGLERESELARHQRPWFRRDGHDEVSVRTDVVSNVYRRWLRELAAEARRGGAAAVVRSLGHVVTAPREDPNRS